jgi:hypothetical protein
MKKIILPVLISAFIIPSIALASWWNPFSWNLWKTMSWNNKQVTQNITATTTTNVATTTATTTTKNNIPTKKIIKKEPIVKISTQTETPQQPYKEIKTDVVVGVGVNTSGSNLTAGQMTEIIQPVVVSQPIVMNPAPTSVPVQIPIQEPAPVPTMSMRLVGSYPSSVGLQNNATLWDSSAMIENGPVILKSITLRMVGSIPLLYMQNFNLSVDGVKFGPVVNEFDNNGNVTFNDSMTLNNGYHDIKLNGDIVINNGDSRNFSFTLRSYESITITDLSGVTIRLSNTEFPIRTSSQTIN